MRFVLRRVREGGHAGAAPGMNGLLPPATPARLRAAGVLGMSARNRDFIARWNPRRLLPRVDDKLLTKELARAAGVAVPALLGVVDAYGDLRRLGGRLAGLSQFVVKPVHGSLGNGVLVVTGGVPPAATGISPGAPGLPRGSLRPAPRLCAEGRDGEGADRPRHPDQSA